ncbi:MAG: hypothetical protein ACHQK8_05700 [Bacteroidia bacterium]
MRNKEKKSFIPETGPGNKNSLWFDILIATLFFLVSLIGIIHHEMWRDELQSWLVARDSHSLVQLFQNARFEGHPILWYLILFILTSFTKSLFALQLLNLFLGTAFIFLFNKFSGFKKTEKILFSFGYYSVFEFTMISRSYNLELLLIAAVLVLFNKSSKNFIWMFVTLFLLANVSAFGLLFAVCFGIIFLWDEKYNLRKIEQTKVSVSKYFSVVLIFIAGIIFSIIQIKPEQGNLVSTDASSLFDFERIKIVFARISDAFFLFPELKILPYWNFSGTMRLDSQDLVLNLILSFAIILACVVILWRKPETLLFFLAASAGIFLLCELPFLIAVRYTGRFFLAFVFSLWLGNYFDEKIFTNNFLNKISILGKKFQSIFLILILISQVIAGVEYYFTDVKMPFSSSKQIASQIQKEHLDTLPILGSQDYAVSSFSALLGKNIFYPESKTPGSFIIWDNQLRKNQNPDFGVVIESINTVLDSSHQKALVILNTLPSGPNGKLEHDLVTPDIKIDLLFQSEKCMVGDEYYYVFLATRVPK